MASKGGLPLPSLRLSQGVQPGQLSHQHLGPHAYAALYSSGPLAQPGLGAAHPSMLLPAQHSGEAHIPELLACENDSNWSLGITKSTSSLDVRFSHALADALWSILIRSDAELLWQQPCSNAVNQLTKAHQTSQCLQALQHNTSCMTLPQLSCWPLPSSSSSSRPGLPSRHLCSASSCSSKPMASWGPPQACSCIKASLL